MLPKAYDPKAVEEKLAKLWKENGVFKAEIDKNKKPFVIVIPPPNITGVLHMGHGLNNTLQDTLIRFNRMNGRSANWVPGTDHGGIATQNVIEKKLSKEQKLSRHDLGREKFVETVWYACGRMPTKKVMLLVGYIIPPSFTWMCNALSAPDMRSRSF